jgi:hypothetical protein
MLKVLLQAALVSLLPWAAGAADPPSPVPVVITTDCGADNAIAPRTRRIGE